MVNLTIDGRAIQAKPGSTILEVAKENGIFIPLPLLPSGLETHRQLPHLRGGRETRAAPAHPGLRHPRHRRHGGGDGYAEAEGPAPGVDEAGAHQPRPGVPHLRQGRGMRASEPDPRPGGAHGGPGRGQAAAQSGLRLPDGGAPPGPLRHLRPLRPRLPGPGGGHGPQLHAAGLLHGAFQWRPTPELRVLRLLHRHLPGGGPDQQAVQVPGPGLGRGQDRDRLPLLRRRLHLPACTPKTARSCGW